MKNLCRIVDYPTFTAAINKRKRKKLVDHIRKERTDKLPEHKIEVMPLYGWYADNNPKRDDGLIKAIVRIKDVVFIILDNLNNGAEEYHCISVDDDVMGFLGATSAPAAPIKKDGTPFLGFRGGRKRKMLTDEEQVRIREMRKEGRNINEIAKELHISNRVISEFVKTN